MSDHIKVTHEESDAALSLEIAVPGLRDAISLLRCSFPTLSEEAIKKVLGLPCRGHEVEPTSTPTDGGVSK